MARNKRLAELIFNKQPSVIVLVIIGLVAVSGIVWYASSYVGDQLKTQAIPYSATPQAGVIVLPPGSPEQAKPCYCLNRRDITPLFSLKKVYEHLCRVKFEPFTGKNGQPEPFCRDWEYYVGAVTDDTTCQLFGDGSEGRPGYTKENKRVGGRLYDCSLIEPREN